MAEAGKHPAKGKQPSGTVLKTAERLLPGWAQRFSGPKWQRWGLIVGTSVIAAFLMSPHSFPTYKVTVGEPASETIIAPKTFRVFDDEATEKKRQEALNSVLPSYDFDDEMVYDVQARIMAAFKFMRDYLADEANQRSAAQERLREVEPEGPNSPTTQPFAKLTDEAQRGRFESLLGTRISPGSFEAFRSHGFNSVVERDLRSVVVDVLEKGVVVSRELVMRDGKKNILIRPKPGGKKEFSKDTSTLYDLKEAEEVLDSTEETDDAGGGRDKDLTTALRNVAKDLINVNITFNRERTNERREAAVASVKRVYYEVFKGEPVIRQGEQVTAGHRRKLAGLSSAYPPYSRQMMLVGFAMMLTLCLRLCFYFSEQHLEGVGRSVKDMLLVCVLLLGTIILVRYLSFYSGMITARGGGVDGRLILYAAPVAIGAMLTALLVDPRLAFVFAPLAALAACLSVEGDVFLFSLYFVSGVVGLHGMSKVVDRTSILRTGLVVGVVNMLMILAIRMALGQIDEAEDLYASGLGFLAGVISGLVVSGIAPVFERLGYVTNVRLLEMANLNHPALKELSVMAPGTYHHSMVVGALAEAAAESIAANPLLAKVGAYYHDIGKVGSKTKPLYFIENQNRGPNPHDKLEPSMSALILVSHVKHGVEKAKEHGLGLPIIDIIQQHHGTHLIRFFYNKALEKAEKNQSPVAEDKYRYPGPRPQTKEAALVMLADVVEAACRTLADPTPARVQKRVQELVLGLFTEGQLDNSTLTLKDLHAITRSFVRSLQGILHARIDYPAEGAPQEKTNGDTHRIAPDKDRHRPGRLAEEDGKNIRRLGL